MEILFMLLSIILSLHKRKNKMIKLQPIQDLFHLIKNKGRNKKIKK